MNTMIISAFPACGKTYLYERQNKLKFTYFGEKKSFTFCDSDSYTDFFEKLVYIG